LSRFDRRNIATVLSLAILVGTEIFGVALAAGWAIGGLLQLGDTVSHGLMLLLTLVGAYGLRLFMRKAIEVEPLHR
jgi:hypothetical protein